MEIEVVCLIPACPLLYIIHSPDSNFRIKAATIFASAAEPRYFFHIVVTADYVTVLLGSCDMSAGPILTVPLRELWE